MTDPKKKKLFEFTKLKLVTFVGFFATLIPVLTYFNVPVPKVAWASDVQQLQEEQLEYAEDLYSRELSRKRQDRLKLLRDQRLAEQEEGHVPDYLLEEQEFLESDIEDLEETIGEARQRLLDLQ